MNTMHVQTKPTPDAAQCHYWLGLLAQQSPHALPTAPGRRIEDTLTLPLQQLRSITALPGKKTHVQEASLAKTVHWTFQDQTPVAASVTRMIPLSLADQRHACSHSHAAESAVAVAGAAIAAVGGQPSTRPAQQLHMAHV